MSIGELTLFIGLCLNALAVVFAAKIASKQLSTIELGQQVIHTLVNSSMTAAMQAEHDACASQLAMMIEIVNLKKQQGVEPSIEVLTAIEVQRSKIKVLKASLVERLEAADKVEEKQADVEREIGKP